MDITKQKTIEMNLPVILTHEELLAYSKSLAKNTQDYSQIESRMKDLAADFKAQLTKTEAEIQILSRKISNEYEYRDVTCHWEFDWNADVKKMYRDDTGECIKTDKISAMERQQGIFDTGEILK